MLSILAIEITAVTSRDYLATLTSLQLWALESYVHNNARYLSQCLTDPKKDTPTSSKTRHLIGHHKLTICQGLYETYPGSL